MSSVGASARADSEGSEHVSQRWGTVECDATGQKNPSFVLEDPAFMQMFLPVAGNCPANTTQVYPEDRGTNYAVRLGDEAARALGCRRSPAAQPSAVSKMTEVNESPWADR